MIRWLRIASLVLLAVWLPGTQHCVLEAAGIIRPVCAHGEGEAEASCAIDVCASLETAPYHSGRSALQVRAPQAQLCQALASLCLPPPRVATGDLSPGAGDTAPHDWVSTWHFARRTALEPRAPSQRLA